LELLKIMKEPKLIDLPIMEDVRGNLTFLEENNHFPFKVGGFKYLFGMPGDTSAKDLTDPTIENLIICLSGYLDVSVRWKEEDKLASTNFSLAINHVGLYLPTSLEVDILRSSTNTIILIVEGEKL